ncbi:hypothetical protein SVIO_104590 [Streptomyces violaceusniger]|uniref:Uncharacterized protein n=1 Tax=Streptomyces violaceusniger TaxID=68280 RepID=A0A4D4LKN2_STRVO|nr:hypothetical protein SVIO_104590 [Streptomyces violaceusniger]
MRAVVDFPLPDSPTIEKARHMDMNGRVNRRGATAVLIASGDVGPGPQEAH